MNSDFHSLEPESRLQGLRVDSADVSIGNNVFIGARVTILKGAQIGDDSVIAAGSVVSGAFPPRVLLAGNPAVVKRVFEPSK
jgi:maltose O-acetyltransferase